MDTKNIQVTVQITVPHSERSVALRWLNKCHTGEEYVPAQEPTPVSLRAALQEFHSSHFLTLPATLHEDGSITLQEVK